QSSLLNLSVPVDGAAPFTAFEHTAATAQHRLHGASAWSTIARIYGEDPKSGREVGRGFRRSFAELQPVAPSGADLPRIDLLGLSGSTINDEVFPDGMSGPILFPNDVTDPPEDIISDPVFIAFDDLFRTSARSSASVGDTQTQSAGPAVRTLLGTNPQTFQFPVDDAALELTVNVYFPINSSGVNVFLADPLGVDIQLTSRDVTSIFDVYGALAPPVEVVSYVVTPPAPGLWSITMSSRSELVETFFEAEMLTGEPPIVLSGSSVFGQEGRLFVPQSTLSVPATILTYPEPFVVVANLNRGLGIRGANVSGTLTRPNGFPSEIELRDDGIAPDLIANDGSYTAEFSYFQNGTYLIRVSADNAFGRAALTYNGTSRSPSDGGFMAPLSLPQLPDERINEDFLRTLDIVVVVQDIAADDHLDFFQAATPVAPDNLDEFGRIDEPGDVDFFSFTAPANPGGTVPLIVRASRLGNGISAKLTVFDIDGRTVIGNGRSSPVGYLFSEVSLVPGFTYFASVEDKRASNFEGTYAFSVGPAVASDTAVVGITSRASGGGGGGGCLIATAAYGTPLAEEIEVLRVLRDTRLLRGAFGTAFVDTYYRLSPPVADAVASNEVLRTGVRLILVPVLVAGKITLATPIWAVMVLVLGAFAAWHLRRKAVTRQT
ncbi:MAG: hypothetical protein IID09_03125, partial [Candidatus Hydrogenedentes bacterium]|nr:hypothetical protein [Candidatus Hydrogenedentota bacterium]